MCHCHPCRRRKSRRVEKRSTKLTSKVRVNVKITNKPKNINKNKLINFDPDFTEAYAGGLLLPVIPPVTP
ncbi:hypothetical protein [Paenibacillus antarcticus]|uniref:Uncharacterized protein n=1 Tax=Paenibacillus antarcticus TaxID=253703 RepID=A0A168QRX9_9BACL|nr:hypothetical protein [Paenibacillus antarcticus]OAB48126.1 hypothetical protein PBAT_00325 [Paenibacillus antarcticus]